jgi:hypothetical protein
MTNGSVYRFSNSEQVSYVFSYVNYVEIDGLND